MFEGCVDQEGRVARMLAGFRAVPARTIRRDMDVFARVRAIGNRPENSVHIGGIDVIADGNDDFAAIGP